MAASEAGVGQRKEWFLGALGALFVCLLVGQAALSLYNRQDIAWLQEELRELRGQQHSLKSNISSLEAQLATCRRQLNPFADLLQEASLGRGRMRRQAMSPPSEGSPGDILEEAIGRIVDQKLSAAKESLRSSGPPGPHGPPGTAGVKGDPGVQGPKGDLGERGLMGAPGVKGAKGDLGEKGMIGEPGPIGLSGHPGQMGVKGEAGVPGPRGEKGEQVKASPQLVCEWKQMVQRQCVSYNFFLGECTRYETVYDPTCPSNHYLAGVKIESIDNKTDNYLQCCTEAG